MGRRDTLGAARWEYRQELRSIRAVVREALLSRRVGVVVTSTRISRGKDD
jgi:hypothetical protein